MALIVFYDTTALDRKQLEGGLKATDHRWEFVDGRISLDTINPDAEIISVFVSSTVTRAMIEAMPKLTLICCRSTGYNNIDFAAVRERGITVVNVPTYGDDTVAEYAFALLLALTRRLERVLTTENKEFTHPELTGMDLSGKTFAVIGAGHIGQKALQIAQGFSMRTLAYDAFPKEELATKLGFTYASLDDVLQQADIISLHTPYLPQTHHLMNETRLRMMKPGAILINTARGALVDTRALVAVLEDGHLGGAALDVIEGEELLNLHDELTLLHQPELATSVMQHSVEISALKKMPQVIISPHVAYNTAEAIGRINGTTVQNIIDFYNNALPNKIDPPPPAAMGTLLLLRHAESAWNAKGVWTGLTDVPLSDKGKDDCQYLGQALEKLNLKLDVAVHTRLIRTKETLDLVLEELKQDTVTIVCDDGFVERDYGTYTGQDKWKIKDEIGEEAWQRVRRGWDVPVPNGETLKMVYERVVPAYQERILPLLRHGKNVLIVGHGNSFRALMKYLESISDEDIEDVEMIINQISVYNIDPTSGLKLSGHTIVVETPSGDATRA